MYRSIEDITTSVQVITLGTRVTSSTGKFGLLSNQGISGSIPLESENTEYLSHTYF